MYNIQNWGVKRLKMKMERDNNSTDQNEMRFLTQRLTASLLHSLRPPISHAQPHDLLGSEEQTQHSLSSRSNKLDFQPPLLLQSCTCIICSFFNASVNFSSDTEPGAFFLPPKSRLPTARMPQIRKLAKQVY